MSRCRLWGRSDGRCIVSSFRTILGWPSSLCTSLSLSCRSSSNCRSASLALFIISTIWKYWTVFWTCRSRWSSQPVSASCSGWALLNSWVWHTSRLPPVFLLPRLPLCTIHSHPAWSSDSCCRASSRGCDRTSWTLWVPMSFLLRSRGWWSKRRSCSNWWSHCFKNRRSSTGDIAAAKGIAAIRRRVV